jgi:predicted ATPase
MSDGSLRLLCWLTLSLSPNLPPLICIDEPEVGLHPRALSTLAGLFKIASARSQLLMSTQSPYFLSQFSPKDIAVMRKHAGRVSLVRGATSQVLAREFSEWGGEALARMFISEELEVLS